MTHVKPSSASSALSGDPAYTVQGRSVRTTRTLGRLAGGAGLAAVLVTGAMVTTEWWGPVEENLGLGPFVISMYWGLASLLTAGLVVPAWRGSASGRRLLGGVSLAGFAAAVRWLSYEPGDARGWAVGITVAVLLGSATAAAALAERRLRCLRGVGLVVAAALVLPLVAVLWQAHAAFATVAIDARLSVSADGRTVRSEFATEPCIKPLRLEVVETPDAVRVLTLARQYRGFPRGCGGPVVPHRLEATLAAPLGSRVLGPA